MQRQFTRTHRNGAEAHAIRLSYAYPHAPADVWAAFTSKERLRRWFAPVYGDLRQGGDYKIEGNAGGFIEACVKQERIALTWEVSGAVSWVEITFAPEGAGTRVTLTHTARTADLPPGFWDQYGPGTTGVGWELGYIGLSLHLPDPEAERPADFEATWNTSPEGIDLITASAEGWSRAATDAGEDEEKARAWVPALIAFFTGIPATKG